MVFLGTSENLRRDCRKCGTHTSTKSDIEIVNRVRPAPVLIDLSRPPPFVVKFLKTGL